MGRPARNFPDLSFEVLEERDLGDSMIAALHLRGHGLRREAEALEAAGLAE